MAVITGTSGPDVLTGGLGDDVINGLEGADQISGGVGNDTINGGAGNDSIDGSFGDDILKGGDGDDGLIDVGGHDSLFGEAGNDRLTSFAQGTGGVLLDGGAGDDTIGVSAGGDSVMALGGSGNDTFNMGGFGDQTIDAGDGDDKVTLGGAHSYVVTLGPGADRLSLDGSYSTATATVVTDYQPGVDSLSFFFVSFLNGWSSAGNPFGEGFARLIQRGTDTVLQLDSDGGANSYTDFLLFKNTARSAFSAADFGGYSIDGSPPLGQTITGTSGPDVLTGGLGDDVINGLEGADQISGGVGNDTINGGAGNDSIDGSFGDDVLKGGDGDDGLGDVGGHDSLFGEAGNDRLFSAAQGTGGVLLDGGAGDDTIEVSAGGDSVMALGGSGNDTFNMGGFGDQTIDAGDGDDKVTLGGAHSYVVTLGPGADRLSLDDPPATATVVTDYQPGVDSLSFFFVSFLNGWSSAGNPFGEGFARLIQRGTDTVLQLDSDGGANSYTDFLLFKNTARSAFSAADFGGYSIDGSPPLGQTITGTSGPDVLTGGLGDDVINGLEGADQISGGVGNDTINGGAGNDSIDGSFGDDVLKGGDGDDGLGDVGGHDSLFGEAGNDRLFSAAQGTGGVLLDGGAGDDTIEVSAGGDSVMALGGSGNDTFNMGGFGDQTIDAGDGDDKVTLGGAHSYVVTLGPGADRLSLDDPPATATVVTDYQPGVDSLSFFFVSFLNGWSSAGNPFGEGFARLIQRGTDTVLQLDSDGGANSYTDFLLFKNTARSAFSAADFGGYPPDQAAEIAVSGNVQGIVDGDNTPESVDGTDFGSVTQGGAAADRVFTVNNTGNLALTTSGLTLPAGFSLVEGLSASIAAGASDTLTVRLNTSTAGSKSGQISFTNNDLDENPFNFSIAGTVNVNRTPVVAVTNAGVRVGQSIAASAMVTPNDADGDSIVQYQVFDEGAGGGHFSLNGVNQPAFTQIVIPGASFAQMEYVGGAVPGTETLWVRANDGFGWGAWTNWNMTSGNQLPAIVVDAATVGSNTDLAASAMFHATDADGDVITQYQVYDSVMGGGRFVLNDVAQAEQAHLVFTALQFTSGALEYRGGTSTGSETLYVRANDGAAWGAWQSWNMATVRNTNVAPVVTGINGAVQVSLSSAVTNFFSVADAENDPIVTYTVRDTTVGGATLMLGGVSQANTEVTVNAAQLATLTIQGGPGPGSDTFEVKVNDGLVNGLSNTANFTVQTRAANHLPTMTVNSTSVRPGIPVAASALVTANDTDGDTITQYQFFDQGAGGGHFRLNGVNQPELTQIIIPGASFAQMEYVGGAVPGAETLWVRANDGFGWGAWLNWLEITGNSAPVVVIDATSVGNGVELAASAMFHATDGDGDTITQYQIYDAMMGGGRFLVNDVPQPELAHFVISAAQYAQLEYKGGAATGSETVYVRANDGAAWGAWQSWNMATVRSTNVAPVVTGVNGIAQVNLPSPVTNFFSVADAENDPIATYTLRDTTAGGATLRLGGVDQPINTDVTVTAAQLATLTIQGGAGPASDTFQVTVNDGLVNGLSNTANFTVQTRAANQLPQVIVGATGVQPGHSVAASAMFTVNDPDGDTITQLQVFDQGVGGGFFRVNNVAQPQGQHFIVAGANIAQLDYLGGPTPGAETLWVRAFDGIAWGAWTNWLETTGNSAPVVTSAPLAIQTNATAQAATLFNVSDADGDAITQYQFFDQGMGGGHFRLNGVNQPEGAHFVVSGANLGQLEYVGGGSAGEDTLWVRANDGTAWGAWTSFTMSTTAAQPDNAGNTLPTARAVTVGAAVKTYADRIDNGDTNDYYRLTLTAAGTLQLNLTGLAANADLQLLDSGGAQLAISQNAGAASETINQALTAGTYYARIFPVGGASTAYSLGVAST